LRASFPASSNSLSLMFLMNPVRPSDELVRSLGSLVLCRGARSRRGNRPEASLLQFLVSHLRYLKLESCQTEPVRRLRLGRRGSAKWQSYSNKSKSRCRVESIKCIFGTPTRSPRRRTDLPKVNTQDREGDNPLAFRPPSSGGRLRKASIFDENSMDLPWPMDTADKDLFNVGGTAGTADEDN